MLSGQVYTFHGVLLQVFCTSGTACVKRMITAAEHAVEDSIKRPER
jgi:hypothetical protein